MLGPTANSLGVMGLDFFQHGGVAFGGAGNIFALSTICLTAGFKLDVASAAGFDLAQSLSAGTINPSLAAGFDTNIELDAGVPECP